MRGERAEYCAGRNAVGRALRETSRAPTRDAGGESHQHSARHANNWRMEPHVCRACFGRVLSQPVDADDDARLYVCSNCGAEAVGIKPAVVCACGIRLRKRGADSRSTERLVDAGIRCHENANRSVSFPSLYVASYAGAQASIESNSD